ncbi:hypothetical protein CIB48_g2469 [Xylaria polymorpha]|nr:hypothetical protein CIB48_g2469 [Xylaria polymorpha]
MSNAGTTRVTSVTGLRKSLRLSSDTETEALLKSDQLAEAFRLYRNRCLVSERTGAAHLPDWHDVDTFLYELRLSSEFRQHVRRASAKGLSGSGSGTRTKSAVKQSKAVAVDPSAAPVDDYLAKLCLFSPYVLMPHVAMFVLRVSRFLESREGRRFDVGAKTGAKGNGGTREKVFDRYSRIMKMLVFLVARDVG